MICQTFGVWHIVCECAIWIYFMGVLAAILYNAASGFFQAQGGQLSSSVLFDCVLLPEYGYSLWITKFSHWFCQCGCTVQYQCFWSFCYGRLRCLTRITYITIMVRVIPDITTIFWAYPLTWSLSSITFLIYYL